MEALVREARAADADGITEVFARSWPATYRGLLPEPIVDEQSIARRRAAIRAELGRPLPPRHRALVIEEARLVVGFVNTAPARQPDTDPAAVAELLSLYLDPAVWGRGLGRQLMERVAFELRELRFESAVLWVVEGNGRARRFYEAAGWQRDQGTRLTEWQTPGGRAELTEVRYRIGLNSPEVTQ